MDLRRQSPLLWTFHYKDEIDNILYKRQLGLKPEFGSGNRVKKQLYERIRCVRSWDPAQTTDHTHHGAIFNFDFSKDGSLLGAACERNSILLFDPHNGRLIAARERAHSDCVNCIRFLDSRTFVSCSDDATVCLWDVRNLKHKIRTLVGHSNWVKNIEYAKGQGLLITSGFDGSIYSWDINKYSEGGVNYTRVFNTSGLMRSKLSPDGSKLIIATTSGYLMVIHDLDLSTLSRDLHGFKPNLYRLMQMRQMQMRQDYAYNHVFTRRRNRVEIIADFPMGDTAEMIASLEVHPQGWCIASRNTSEDDRTEWTCIHDIQEPWSKAEKDSTPSKETDENQQSEGASNSDECPGTPRKRRRCSNTPHPTGVEEGLELQTDWPEPPPNVSDDNVTIMMLGPHEVLVRHLLSGATSASTSVPGAIYNPETDSYRRGQLRFTATVEDTSSSDSSSENETLASTQFEVFDTMRRSRDVKIHENNPRLTHYIEEPNVGRGFIKEIAFSSDGRLICSPFGFGVRMLSFDCHCSELCDCVPDSPRQLHEVGSNMSHTKEVVTTKFSPTHCALVTGCLNGKVDFHQPVL